ncbi:carbohydrate kinase family protein [Macellibacteroides fermentans]|uniref:Sugar or nucleoside kinase, ribokinase family n=2 Tax=Bacteroidales TaxID=171549 RepID=A0A1T5DUY2_9BACT|nr:MULTISPECIES: PfkB family carbohydrate kinase [Bacteroidales]NYI50378.1 sugar/nucleoside kinase (ribokinase family) [Macellibacteroides fermentans]SKB75505.1 Sugar or nucleoside kinase, ribokinase family [Parabacteroides chartae]
MHDLCCVGHITLDKVVTPKNTVHMPGGTSFYFSHAIRNLKDINYTLVTAIAESEMAVANDLQSKGIDVKVMPSKHSVYFENIYGENQDNRTQRVLAKADPFTVDYLEDIDARIYHLGSLLADDFSLDVIRFLSQKGLVSVDSQGYLREVREQNVYAVDWTEKKEALQYIHFLKANEHEMEVLTGYDDVAMAAKQLYDWGVKEVLITLGSMGSVIYDGTTFHKIPAYKPKEVVDATGCGDTYMTGYLYKRAKGAGIEEAGRFAAAMSTLKIECLGPFKGTKEDIEHCLETAEQRMPEL